MSLAELFRDRLCPDLADHARASFSFLPSSNGAVPTPEEPDHVGIDRDNRDTGTRPVMARVSPVPEPNRDTGTPGQESGTAPPTPTPGSPPCEAEGYPCDLVGEAAVYCSRVCRLAYRRGAQRPRPPPGWEVVPGGRALKP